MALSDKLDTIDTIENLATNRDFLGKLITELSKGANNASIYTKKGVDDELKKKADKNYVDTELGKKAGAADLANKANTADVYTKTAADTAFVKATELKTKAAAKDVVDKIIASSDFTNKVYTKVAADASFAKIDGSNATEAGAKAILATLTGNDQVVKTSELPTKAAAKAVVDKIIASSDFINNVYTKVAADASFAKVDGSNATEAGAKAILATLTGNDQVVKTSELPTKAAEKLVVEAIFDAQDGNNKISEIKIGATFAKKDASNLTDAANQKAFAEAILPAKDGNKSILVDKLGGFLAENARAYSNNAKTAKELLVPLAADLLQDHDFTEHIDKSIKEMAVSSNSDFQKNVREVMSQPYFEPPTGDDAALNWTW